MTRPRDPAGRFPTAASATALFADGCGAGATLSPDQRYRYRLWRTWAAGPVLGWLMLNPSTADAETNDPTIRRCSAIAKRDGYGGIIVTNLFALRATNPRELWDADDPVGPDNDEAIIDGLRDAAVTVLAWGSQRKAWPRIETVERLIATRGAFAYTVCVGITAEGQPRHPLYVSGDAPFLDYGV